VPRAQQTWFTSVEIIKTYQASEIGDILQKADGTKLWVTSWRKSYAREKLPVLEVEGYQPSSTYPGSSANGIKLASERLLDQLPAQFLSGFNHEREALGSPLFDPRLCPMQADGVDKQGS
jgi:hypothetical protein